MNEKHNTFLFPHCPMDNTESCSFLNYSLEILSIFCEILFYCEKLNNWFIFIFSVSSRISYSFWEYFQCWWISRWGRRATLCSTNEPTQGSNTIHPQGKFLSISFSHSDLSLFYLFYFSVFLELSLSSSTLLLYFNIYCFWNENYIFQFFLCWN